MIQAKVLFLCTGKSRRTQMAEGFLRSIAGDRFDVVSTGSEDTPLDPDAVLVMREVGIDISDHETKAVASRSFLAIWRLQWDLEGPSLASTSEERRKALRRVRDEIQQRVTAFVAKNR